MRHLVYDEQVRANVSKLQQLLHLSTDGVARGADVIERVAYVGSDHLVPYRERQDVSWRVRYNVDVYAIGVCAVLAVLYGVCRLLALLVSAALARAGITRQAKSKLA